ncbi:MAG: DUF2497 domain-containing protein [Geminicoccaceae bacterium]
MADSKTAQEPSMEEILSSIRRIIAEDDPGSGAVGSANATGGANVMQAMADDEDDDVLELTEVVGGPGPSVTPPAVAHSTQPPPPAPPPAVTPTTAAMEPRPMPASAAESLISPLVANASTQAFARLARAATTDDKKEASGVTVEQLVVDLLTPMLRDWLDKNLPEIVERVVEQEVKKLARRAELM